MPASATRITVNDIDCLDPYDLYEWAKGNGYDTSRFWGLVNSLWIPRGIEPSRAFLLLTYAVVANSLNRDDPNTIRVFDSNVSTESGSITFAGWYLVRATPLFPGVNPYDPSTAYIAEFTDCRGIAALFSAPVYKQYNVRSPEGGFLEGTAVEPGDFSTDPVTPAAPKSWEQMLQELWDELPDCMGERPSFTGLNLPAIPNPFPLVNTGSENPDGSAVSFPENYIFDGVPALQAIGRVLNDLDLTLTPPFADGFLFKVANLDLEPGSVSNFDAPAIAANSGFLIDAWQSVYSAMPIIPRAVEVHFPAANYQWQTGDTTTFCDMDHHRRKANYRKFLYTIEHLPPSGLSPLYLGSEGLLNTVRVLFDSQLADWMWDEQEQDFKHVNQEFLDAIALQRVKKYIRSTYYAELPARYVYSGIPPTIATKFTQDAAERPPNGRWSALYIHDLGGRGQSSGLRLELLRYPRLAPNTVNASIFRASINLDKGSGGGPAWAPWATCRPGDTIGTQGITFSSSEIGAPPALARPAGSFVGTPFHRFAVVRPVGDIAPGQEGECTFLYFTPASEGDTADQSDLPFLTDQVPEEELKLAGKSASSARVAKVFNPFVRSAVTLNFRDTVLVRWDWQAGQKDNHRGRWIAVSVPRQELLELANVTGDGTATLQGVKYGYLAGKKINTTKFCPAWETKNDDVVLVWHQTGPRWMIIAICKAETATLDVVTDVRCESESINPDTGAVERRLVMDKVNVTVISINEDPAAPAPAPPAVP